MIEIKELPKIGDKGLAIHHSLYSGGWFFTSAVSKFMRSNEINECWFQTYDNDWRWFHGIVKINKLGMAQIVQIG